MTLAEFKAWFEGYTEGMDEKAPNAKQWAKIKAKVADIDGTPVTYPIYIERYVQPWRPYWDRYWSTAGGATWGGSVATYASNATLSAKGESVTEPFNAQEAMYALGRAEAMN